MPKTEVPITGSVLAWAMDEAGIDDETLAKRAKVSVDDVQAWKAGTERPGKTQFNAILAAVRRPSAIFYMPAPPSRAAPSTAYRRAPGPTDHVVSPSALREVRRALRIQRVTAWLYESSGDRQKVDLPIFDRSTTDPLNAAAKVRRSFNFTLTDQVGIKSIPDAYRVWRELFDDRGILAFSLTLGTDEIRGFSSWNDYAPLIAANTAYVDSARIYTLAHELAHLCLRIDSACFEWIAPEGGSRFGVERWCEEFAAGFLLPPEQLLPWLSSEEGITANAWVTDFDTVWRISRRLKVSARAMAIALIDAGRASRSLYALIDSRARQVDRPPPRDGEKGFGRPNPEKRITQFGRRAPSLVLDAVESGTLSVRDAADYLDVNLGDLDDIGSLLSRGAGIGA